MDDYRYDVALSFAGEDRDYVERVAHLLQPTPLRVFYDRFEEATLWGENLVEHLATVYGQQSRFVVMFVSVHYARKAWPTHERRAAMAAAVGTRRIKVLPARFDSTEVPGLLSDVSYIDLAITTPEILVERILQKVASETTCPTSPTEEKNTTPGVFANFRRPAGCEALARLISTRSEKALDWDPQVPWQDALEALRSVSQASDLEKDLRRTVHELEQAGLVKTAADANSPLGWHIVGPTEDFFWQTDSHFTAWDPADDARELCRRAVADDESFAVQPLDHALGWGPRRMNPALAYLVANGLAEGDRTLNTLYLYLWGRLTPEGSFLAEEEPSRPAR